MNPQRKFLDGVLISRGIEWTDFTWNMLSGCLHGCRWVMPDGQVAVCYAEETALSIARRAYPRGFANHYPNPHRRDEPLKTKEPAKIFLDSMGDVFGAWVPPEQIADVLSVAREAKWHVFQSLTKNAPRILKFADLL